MRNIVGITCLLAGLSFLGFSIACGCGSPDVARAVKVQADLNMIRMQLEAYNAANGTYPSAQQGLAALVVKPVVPPIPSHWTPLFKELPKDAWQNDYVYRQPGGMQSKYDLFSPGPDHIADTADDVRRK